jgi:hypothetical protein
MRPPRWILLAAGLAVAACSRHRAPVDADGDGVVAGQDCDDSNPAVHTTITAYRDLDGDGVGAGPPVSLCTNGVAPAGYSLVDTDCAPDDPAAWRLVDKLVDRDGDGYTIKEPGSLCVGNTVPAPYLAAANGNDCDDSNPSLYRWVVLYQDKDGDGVGARPRTISCIGASLPAGTSLLGYDVDDSNPAVISAPNPDDFRLLFD